MLPFVWARTITAMFPHIIFNEMNSACPHLEIFKNGTVGFFSPLHEVMKNDD